jgi:hypothetical protein
MRTRSRPARPIPLAECDRITREGQQRFRFAQTRCQRSFQYNEYAGCSLSRREELLAAVVFPVFTEPLDARNLGLAEHGEELIPAPRKVARVGWQKGLDFSCHLSANCSNVPVSNANIYRGVNVTVQYLS